MPRAPVKDKRKQQLIQATMDSIAKRGLTETTITHICQGANLSRGIVNFYFESKEKLMQEVLRTLLEDSEGIWQQSLKRAGEGEHEALKALVSAQFDRRVCSSKRLNVLSAFWGHAASHSAYLQLFEKHDAALQEALAAHLPRRQGQGSASERARLLFALIRGLWLRYLLAPKQTNREDLAEEVILYLGLKNKPLEVVSNKKHKAPAPKRKAVDAQMDIEDLFANG